MRKLNVKFLLCLVAAAVIFGGGVVLAHSLQFKRIPLALLKQARKAEDQGDLNRTIGYLNRYLAFAPDDGEQRIRLALLLADPKIAVTAKARSNAFEALEKALSYDASRHDLRRLAVPLAIELHKLSKAKEHLRQLPADGERAALWGKWHEAQQTFPEAIIAYREAVKLSPTQTDNYVRLARLLREGRADTAETTSKARAAANREADQVMAALIAKNPKSWQAYIARWNYRRDFCLRQPRQEIHSTLLRTVFDLLIQEAGEDVARALELAEGELNVRLAAAELAQLQDDLVAARAHLDKAMQLHRKEPRIYRAFAGLELQVEEKTKDPGERKQARARAEAWLRQGVEVLVPPAQLDVLWAHATLLIDSGGPAELDEASKVIDKIRDANFLPAGVTFLRGRVLFARQQWAEAARLLERARAPLESSEDLTNQIDTMLARCFSELDDRSQERAVIERLAKRKPNAVTAKLALARAEQRAGNLKEALAHYKQLLRMEDVPADTWVEMLRLKMLIARQVSSKDAWQDIDEALDEMEKENKADKVDIAILRAESLVAQQKPEEAQRILDTAKTRSPDRVELWTALAGLAEHRRNPEQALKVLDEADRHFSKSKPGDKAELKLARARHWVDHHDEHGRAELKKLEEGLDRFPTDEHNFLLNGLAEAQYRAGNFRDAARLWKALAAHEEHRKDLRLRLVLFDLALQAGKSDEMADTLRDIESLEGKDGTFGRHAQALRLVWEVKQGKLDEATKARKLTEALNHLEQVKAARGSWAAPLLTEAEIETLRGNPDRVIQCYRDARANGDRNPLVVRHLVEALRKQGKIKEAEEELRKLSRADLDRNSDLQRVKSLLLLQGGNPNDAVAYALGAVQNDSRDYRDHLWLGGLLAAAGKEHARQAEEHLRRAVELGSLKGEPEPYVALVGFLAARKERAAEAEAVLAEVRAKVPPEQQPLTLARCYAYLGKDEARKAYEAALQAAPDDPAVLKDFASFHLQREQFKEAEPLLRRLLDGKRKLSEEDAQWAHARLALLLAAGNDFARFKEALRHVGLRIEQDGTFARDTHLIATETTDVRR
ncbi:MAG TPA: tetratricopeptide repeat protein, partial [Gemmataceae bacterium]|nr:tetratricopeptide repeat protein [Gemmataceae bacterium]